jgi:arginine/ornithine N-succinyltransferase beta subunit
VTDIVERIEEAFQWDTFWDTDAPPLLRDAVDEIKRLRQSDRSQPIKPAEDTPATHATLDEGSVQNMCTLTVEEQAAIEAAAIAFDGEGNDISAVLRHLLERLPTR